MSAFLRACGGLGLLCLVWSGCSGRVGHEHWHLRTWGDLGVTINDSRDSGLTKVVYVDVVLVYDEAVAKLLADEKEDWFEYAAPDPDDPEASIRMPGSGERFRREHPTRLQIARWQSGPSAPDSMTMGNTERAVTGWVFAAGRDPDYLGTDPWQEREEFDPRKDIVVGLFGAAREDGGAHIEITQGSAKD